MTEEDYTYPEEMSKKNLLKLPEPQIKSATGKSDEFEKTVSHVRTADSDSKPSSGKARHIKFKDAQKFLNTLRERDTKEKIR